MLRVGPRDLGTGKPAVEQSPAYATCRACGRLYALGAAQPPACGGLQEGEDKKPCPVAVAWPNVV